jgi:hypothetical protein
LALEKTMDGEGEKRKKKSQKRDRDQGPSARRAAAAAAAEPDDVDQAPSAAVSLRGTFVKEREEPIYIYTVQKKCLSYCTLRAKNSARRARQSIYIQPALHSFFAAVEPMMYGFGDDPAPLPETVSLMEDMVIEYASGLAGKLMDAAAARGKVRGGKAAPGSLQAEDLLHAVRKVSRMMVQGGFVCLGETDYYCYFWVVLCGEMYTAMMGEERGGS